MDGRATLSMDMGFYMGTILKSLYRRRVLLANQILRCAVDFISKPPVGAYWLLGLSHSMGVIGDTKGTC